MQKIHTPNVVSLVVGVIISGALLSLAPQVQAAGQTRSLASLTSVLTPDCADAVITQRFSFFHKATDITASDPCIVKSAGTGTVEFAGWSESGYGYMVLIDHGHDLKTLYAHGKTPLVKAGETVSTGTELFEVGESGRSTGHHLHFEVRSNGTLVNPEKLTELIKKLSL